MQLSELDHPLVLLLISIVFLILHQVIILFLPSKKKNDLPLIAAKELRSSSAKERLIGIFTLGVLPVSILAFNGFEAQNFVGLGETFYWPGILYIIIAIFLILAFVNYASHRMDLSKTPSAAKYFGVRNSWLIKSTVLWGLYLFAYELLLRGFLLFSSLELFGAFFAILINCLIYSIIHIPKGRSEAIGAIPFGIILCLVTLYTESFWGAYILHLTLAVPMDWKVARRIRKQSELNF